MCVVVEDNELEEAGRVIENGAPARADMSDSHAGQCIGVDAVQKYIDKYFDGEGVVRHQWWA